MENLKNLFSLDNISMTVVQFTRDCACILKDVNK